MELILIIHVFTTFFMAGLCWFVQIVHYPLFHQIKLADFPEYERRNAVTAFITVPVMIVELLTGLYLLYIYQDYLFLSNMIFLGFIWLSTMIFQVPMHLKLMSEASTLQIKRVINTNWIRTISWTIRSGILIYILYQIVR